MLLLAGTRSLWSKESFEVLNLFSSSVSWGCRVNAKGFKAEAALTLCSFCYSTLKPSLPIGEDSCVCWVRRSCITPACPQLSLAKWDICTPQKCFPPSEQTDVTVLRAAVLWVSGNV